MKKNLLWEQRVGSIGRPLALGIKEAGSLAQDILTTGNLQLEMEYFLGVAKAISNWSVFLENE